MKKYFWTILILLIFTFLFGNVFHAGEKEQKSEKLDIIISEKLGNINYEIEYLEDFSGEKRYVLIEGEKCYLIYDLEIDDYDLSKYSVFIKTESEGSGSTRKVLNRVYVDNSKIIFDISTDRALIGTDDMVYWYFVAIIDKDQLINLDLSDWKRPSGE